MATATRLKSLSSTRSKDGYENLLDLIRNSFETTRSGAKSSLFTTDASGLWEMFLANLPKSARQHYTCTACRHFIERHGGLVWIDKDDATHSAMWEFVEPDFFSNAVSKMRDAVLKSRITGVFVSKEETLGQPVTGEWKHMSVENSNAWRGLTLTANQRAAQYKEEYKMLITGLVEYPESAIDTALTLLKSDALYRSEKCLGVAEWLKALHVARNSTKNTRVKENLTWLAVATAPAGFCHVKSTMIGTLLDDIVAGLDYESISRRFADKMHPLQYQRPQVAPTSGNILQAEKIIEQLKAAGSLERRFARLDEVEALWRPVEKSNTNPVGGGVFAHLAPKKTSIVNELNIPPQVMTWTKFQTNVLPTAEEIEFLVNPGRANYCALLTAVHPKSTPILQWDNSENRNPFSCYVYNGGSTPEQWKLTSGFCRVTAVCLQPSMWRGLVHSNQGKSVIFLLSNAQDTRESGNALFPEILKSELHSIRATIEAYSRVAKIQEREQASACGIRLEDKNTWSADFRVLSNGQKLTYRLDRWD